MQVGIRVEGSVTEMRRLLGLPDVLPLAECLSAALERGLALRIAETGPALAPAPRREK